MDLDALAQVHADEWAELDRLAGQRQLTGAEADRLVQLYQRVGTHLSTVRSTSADPAMVGHLSMVLLRARSRLTGAKEPWRRELSRFFLVSFPAALWRIRWWTAWTAVAFYVVALLVGWRVGHNPQIMAQMMSDDQIEQVVNHEFVDYYSENPAASFAWRVWSNNAWIAAQCVAFGVVGFVVPYVLFSNAVNLGAMAGLMISHGRGDVFFIYILPHGLLELTCVLVAGAAGLRIFWSWVAPGPLPRGESLAREGRSLATVALGLIVVLFISGLLEAFITPSPLPPWLRITIGVLALAGFLAYAGLLGSRSAAAGETGDLRIEQRGAEIPVSG